MYVENHGIGGEEPVQQLGADADVAQGRGEDPAANRQDAAGLTDRFLEVARTASRERHLKF